MSRDTPTCRGRCFGRSQNDRIFKNLKSVYFEIMVSDYVQIPRSIRSLGYQIVVYDSPMYRGRCFGGMLNDRVFQNVKSIYSEIVSIRSLEISRSVRIVVSQTMCHRPPMCIGHCFRGSRNDRIFKNVKLI